ncbi:MAG: ECF transporter S component [Bacillota bacterium]|jgi:hypothetical protein
MMRLDLRSVVRTAVFLAIAVVVQSMRMPQLVTGSAVNAVLYVTALYLGPVYGAAIGCLTPWIALLTGIMKLAPLLPVVIAGNVTLALMSGYVGKKSRYLGVGLAAVAKYLVMTMGVKYLISLGTKVPPAAYTMFTTTQLVTALIGAGLALIIYGAIGRVKRDGSSS